MFPNLSKPQAEVLAAFSFGIAKAKSRPLSAVARDMTLLGTPDTVETLIRGFVSNPRIDMSESCETSPERDSRPAEIEGLDMRRMMRVSKIVRVIMEDEAAFPFKSLTVEPGKSWRKKAKAFKNAGWSERLGGAPFTNEGVTSRGAW